MQANRMGDAPASEMEWNEPFFRDCFDNVDKVVTWVSRKGNPFARHQTIAQFASQASMTERVLQQKVFKALAKDALFLEWLAKQPRVIRLEVHAPV
jgi:hypothetical protein